MLKPLEEWICDRCKQTIEKTEEGLVEWTDDEDLKVSGFKIVHHSARCQYTGNRSDVTAEDLNEFIGQSQMVQLLRFLDIGRHFDANCRGPMVSDLREFVEFVRRLTVPYYEEARTYWSEAQSDGYFNDTNEITCYLPDTLKEIIRRYGP